MCLSNSDNCCLERSSMQNFMSKKKKIEVLEKYIECLDDKKEDIKEAINELKQTK